MKRTGNLYPKVITFNNLYISFLKAFKGCRKNTESLHFFFNLEYNLWNLKKELEECSYCPGKYRYFKIYDPKERIIAVAPFRDRIVHHAIVNVLEPVYEKIFIYDSYATRKHKGTHKAILRAQRFLKNNRWFLKTDIRKYFDSVNHDILLKVLKRKIKDKKMLWLLEKIIKNGGKNGKGLPIGNLTSQFLANVYLDIFDHFVKDKLQVKYYVRYMDDMVFFSNDKSYLNKIHMVFVDFLNKTLNLTFKNPFINQQLNGLSFLGARIFPKLLRIKPKSLNRCVKKIKKRFYEQKQGKIEEESLKQTLASIDGYISFYNARRLKPNFFSRAGA